MSDDRGSNASGVILSFLLGGLTGAALAILFAPRSGRETRDMLGDKLREGAERGKEFRERVATKGREIVIPTAKPSQIVDPTGCGDACRAGLLHGLLHGLDWETTGRIASLLGAIKIESRGTQNHSFTRSEFEQRYRASFGTSLSLG